MCCRWSKNSHQEEVLNDPMRPRSQRLVMADLGNKSGTKIPTTIKHAMRMAYITL
jgi:hypothetical protein